MISNLSLQDDPTQRYAYNDTHHKCGVAHRELFKHTLPKFPLCKRKSATLHIFQECLHFQKVKGAQIENIPLHAFTTLLWCVLTEQSAGLTVFADGRQDGTSEHRDSFYQYTLTSTLLSTT